MFLFLLLDSDCSGRSLATLLVTWVGAAMIASILLRWKYMWIVLALLTLLFLIVCGYTACNAKRAQERSFVGQSAGRARRSSRSFEGEIYTLSGRLDEANHRTGSAGYQPPLMADLPPSYSTVMSSELAAPVVVSAPRPEVAVSSPPPYSIAVAASQPEILLVADDRDTDAFTIRIRENATTVTPEAPPGARNDSIVLDLAGKPSNRSPSDTGKPDSAV